MHKAAVAILNWNGIHWLGQFIGQVSEYSQPHPVYVIDNASDDDSLDYLKRYHPQIKIIRLDKNYGFAEGYNKGLQQIDADVFILLNSDVEVTPQWIDPILELMDRNPIIAAVQPKILSYKQKDEFEYAGAAGGMLDLHGVPFCRGRIFDHLEKDHGQYEENAPIFWASGAAFFVRSDRFREVGGLDADFFAHMEEIDLCWRLQNKGYEIFYSPLSKVYHVGGGTLNKVNPRKYYLNFRNSLSMLLKNLPSNKLFSTIMVRLCLDGAAALKMAISGKPIMLWVVLKAHFAFYFRIWSNIAKRKAAAAPILPKMMYHKSIIKSHYIDKKNRFTEL